MAEGYLRYFGKDNLEVYSAGIETHGVNPRAIQVMREDGIDISKHTSNHVDEYADIKFDWVITVCDNAKENCPYFPGNVKRLHHNFPDPAKATGSEEQILKSFRQTRDLIKDYAQGLVANTFK